MFFFFGYKLLLVLAAAVVGAFAARHRTRLRKAEYALEADVEALGRVAPGGTPGSALEVPSTAVVEGRATALPCHVCGEVALKVEEHSAREVDGERLRVVRVSCTSCGAEREVFVRVVTAAS
ncbi:MAG: hypothetical protein JST54_18875 [Deltaproteobacteria bacterium]|nr:hypothetical protein [Deltaproteobacteria bacterium]